MNGLPRVMLAVLAATMAVTVWVACGQETPAPPMTSAPTIVSPTETVAATSPSSVSRVALTENPTGTPVTTALSTPPQQPLRPQRPLRQRWNLRALP